MSAAVLLPRVAVGRELSFAERVACQEALSRIEYSHQIGVAQPFEEAVPRADMEDLVRTVLRQSAALERRGVTLSAADLEAEMQRISSRTQMPNRLLEVYLALGEDGFLVQECLARPLLVERLLQAELAAAAESGSSPVPSELEADAQEIDIEATPAIAASDAALPLPATTAANLYDTWTPMSVIGAPSPRRLAQTVWTGSRLIVWSGYDDFGPPFALSDGRRYDPVTDTWSGLASTGNPGFRVEMMAVWTGSQMLVWGGYPPTRAGGRYNPVTNRWSAMPVAGAPAGRYRHSTVWTGKEMIVWGGFDNEGGYFGNGGAYDEVSNLWRPLSLVGAPTARNAHTAVWTGTRMLVWGGRDQTRVFADGAAYDLETNTWTPIPAPSMGGRSSHTAVWTGSSMLIWGGVPSPNRASLYDPETGSWSDGQNNFALAPRVSHTTAWTGREMLIWGGWPLGSPNSSGTGSRYDPAKNRWTPISSVNAPSDRLDHGAAWTGESWIIWGGTQRLNDNGVGMRGDGAIYHALPPNASPVASAGQSRQVDCTSLSGAMVHLDGSGSSDPDSSPGTQDDIASFRWYLAYGLPGQVELGAGVELDVVLPLGTHLITLRVEDRQGAAATDTIQVTVIDEDAPDLWVTLTPTVLWPPDHRLVTITALLRVEDACSTPTVTLETVVSSDPYGAPVQGTGHTADDIQGVELGSEDTVFLLRAERSGARGGRIYTVTYRAVDGAGNEIRSQATVLVPHDRSDPALGK